MARCEGKTRHNDEEQCRAVMAKLRKRGWQTKYLVAYSCPHCKGWHLGRYEPVQPNWVRDSR